MNIDSILFLTFSTFTVACILYLPDHLATISRRTYYYFAGEAGLSGGDVAWQQASAVGGSVAETAGKASEAVMGAATEFAQTALQAASGSAAGGS